jgi:type IV secretory pathway VirB6-like protein
VPLETMFFKTATEYDSALVEGMNNAITGGLIWARPMLGTALSLYVIGYAFLMMYGKIDGWVFVKATLNSIIISSILTLSNYNYYVRDFFFTDMPNEIARALNGPRVTVNSAQQFDVVWSAVLNYSGFILSQTTGVSNTINRGLIWLLAGMNNGALWVCFGAWYISRVFMALVIAAGPFLIILGLFDYTRGYLRAWIDKLVGLTVLGIGASILLRFVIMIMNSRMRDIGSNPGISVDEMIANAASVTGVFWLSALMMITLPSVLAIGASFAAGSAVVGGFLGGAVSAVGGVAKSTVRGAANAGKALGHYTGSR